jgi:hypothetical protein
MVGIKDFARTGLSIDVSFYFEAIDMSSTVGFR